MSSGRRSCMRSGMATTLSTNTFLQRLIGAAALDAAIYEEVEADRRRDAQAFAIVIVLSSLAAGIGAAGFGGHHGVNAVLLSASIALLAWAAWALLTLRDRRRASCRNRRPAWTSASCCAPSGSPRRPGCCACSASCRRHAAGVRRHGRSGCCWRWSSRSARRSTTSSTGRAVAVCVLGWILAIAIAVALGVLFGPTVS